MNIDQIRDFLIITQLIVYGGQNGLRRRGKQRGIGGESCILIIFLILIDFPTAPLRTCS
jgi:hypothetical protein